MRKARYRIDKVTIEGFRGFTTPQTVALQGKNLFIFGPNGRGKSSLVEAIRWCLFGSQSGKEIEVRNTFYERGDCAVTISLAGGDGPLQLRREMRPGGDRSRLTIRNAANEEVSLKAALPELARIGHDQGTQVIFAAQQATGRHATVDLADFTQVLCFYLHLEDAPELVKRLRRILEERTAEAERLAQSLAIAEQVYRIEIDQVQINLNAILSNAPWGDGPAPTGDESNRRIATVLAEQARLHGVNCPRLSGKSALAEMRRWIDSAESTSGDSRQHRLGELVAKLQRVRVQSDALKVAISRTAAIQADQNATQKLLSKLLTVDTVDRLRTEARDIEKAMSVREIRGEIARMANSISDYDSVDECPLCNGDVGAEDLKRAILGHLNEAEDVSEDESRLAALRSRIHEIDRTQKLLESQAIIRSGCEVVERNAKTACYETTGLDNSADVRDVERAIEKLNTDVESLKREMAASSTERQRKIKLVKDLDSELNYHDFRDRMDRLRQSLEAGMDSTRNVLAGYRDLLRAISDITSLVDGAFNDALDRIAPELNQLLTEVYSRLTRQVSYDQIRISRSFDPPIRRELKVASSRLPDQTFPPNVLNGQAAKALQLVPYFVFSRFQPEIMELDLLLIDDPSESFDTSHVESLVAELAEAAKHAQIIVATHEREKFAPHLKSMFRKNAYQVVSVENFDPIGGPTIDYG